jgi:phosphatidylinositol glycan class B
VSSGARLRSSQVTSTSEQRLALIGLSALAAVGIGLRLVPVLLIPSLNWADEIFQATEQAHRLVYGVGLVPWEFQLGVRSWLLPGAIAALMELARIAGDGPDYYLAVIAVAFAVLGTAPVVCCFLWCRRLFGLAGAFVAATAVAVAPELVYFGARTLSEVVAGHLLVAGLYVVEPGYRVTSPRRLFAGGALLGLVFLVRIQLAPALLVVALWPNWRTTRERAPAMLAGATVMLFAAGILDTVTLGCPLASLWRYILYNVYYGVSSSFGVEPWNYYLRAELGTWGGAVASILLLSILGARRMPLLLAAALAILAVHSSIPHKEYRFVFPAVELLMVLVGVGLAQLARWGKDRWRGQSVSGTVAISVGVAIASSFWAAMSFIVWSGPILAGLRDSAHDNLLAASFVAHGPAPCGIGLYGRGGDDWAAYGGYTYFHWAAPMYWPKDEAALAAFAAGFDTLVYTQSPPPPLGFATLRCFGRVCVARRPGPCRSIATMPLPLPDPLVGIAAAKSSPKLPQPHG